MAWARLSVALISAIIGGVGLGLFGIALALNWQARIDDNWTNGLGVAFFLYAGAYLVQLLYDPDPVDGLRPAALITPRWWISHWSHVLIGSMCVAALGVVLVTIAQPLHGVNGLMLEFLGGAVATAASWLPTLTSPLLGQPGEQEIQLRRRFRFGSVASGVMLATAVATFAFARRSWPGFIQIAQLELIALLLAGVLVLGGLARLVAKIMDWMIDRSERRDRAHG